MNLIFLQVDLPPNNFIGYLLWSIAILVGVVAFIFKLLHSNYKDRISEKDKTIERQDEEIRELHVRYDDTILELKMKMEEYKKLTDKLIKTIEDGKAN